MEVVAFLRSVWSVRTVRVAGVAQLVEQLTCNQQVTSSSLVASSRQLVRVGSEVVKRNRL